MSITRTVVAIATFNVICCIFFFVFKFLLFYDVIELNSYKRGGDWIFVYKSKSFYGESDEVFYESEINRHFRFRGLRSYLEIL